MVGHKGAIPVIHSEANGYATGRPVVHGAHGLVAAGHHLTTMSAVRILLDGGNAFDAAAAAGFTAAVVEPIASYSLAAEGSFMLYSASTRQVRVLSGQGVAAGAATVELFKERGLDKIPTGPGPNSELSFTVPGVVDAFISMLETYGTKTLGDVVAPALDYAQRGFPMYDFMRRRLQIRETREQFKNYPPGGMEVFFPGGQPHQVGQMLVQPQLGATLGKLVQAEQEAAGDRLEGLRAARDVFYKGDVARTIVQCSDGVGGLLALEDLANYRARFEEPISTAYMGYEICAQSTWTQGALLLQALNILERFDLPTMGHNTPQYVHTVIETLKLAFADRERYYGDPEFATVPLDGLLSKEYAAQRAKLIDPNSACPMLPEAGDPWRYASTGVQPATGVMATPTPTGGDGGGDAEGGTTHFVVIDRDGNMVCATPSGGAFGKSVFFPELGCTLSTRSEMFFLAADHPNGLQPGKRPRTTLVNYMVCKDGQPVMTIGCPGGDNQAQADLQLILNVLVFGMDPQQAVEAPRFSTQSVPNSFYPHVYLPGQLGVERGISGEVRASLATLDHKVVDADNCGIGAIVATRDPETGAMSAGADPRRTSSAIAW